MKRGFVFDMDGVIFDTERLYLNAWRNMAKIHGLKDIDNSFSKIIGVNHVGGNRIFHEIYGPDFPYEEYRATVYKNVEEEVKANGWPVKPFARETLSLIRDSGYKIALASSTDTEDVKKKLASRDLLKYFSNVIGGDMIKNGKPAPDIYIQSAKALELEPAECFGVEDSPNGVRSSHAAGLYTIMVPDLVSPDDEMKRTADVIISDLSVVASVIEDDRKGILG